MSKKYNIGDEVFSKVTNKRLTIVWVGELGKYLGFTDDKGYFEMSVDNVYSVGDLDED